MEVADSGTGGLAHGMKVNSSSSRSCRTIRRGLAAALLLLGACGTDAPSNPAGGGGGGGAGTGAAAGSGGSSAGTSGGGRGGSGPGTAGSGGTSSTGSAGIGGPGGSTGTGGRGGSAGGGGSSSAGTGGSAAAGRGGGAGGSTVTGAGGGAGGATGSGGTSGSACTRDLLKSTITKYFAAMAAHDPTMLPLAANAKFTENGRVMTIGQMGLWPNAGMVKYTQSALDVDVCGTATHAVVPEGTMDIPFALRLKLVNAQITEIETIAVRPGDYTVNGPGFQSDTAQLIAADQTIGWEDPVPENQRAAKADLTGWIEKYFRAFPQGICNTTMSCVRLENGGDFPCGSSCTSGSGSGSMTARALIADVETGIGAGFTMFMGNTDMHMMKMYNRQVHAVHAIIGMASSSGW